MAHPLVRLPVMYHVLDMTKDLLRVITGVLPGVMADLLAVMVDLLAVMADPAVSAVLLGVTAVLHLQVATAVRRAEHILSMEMDMCKAATTRNPKTEVCYVFDFSSRGLLRFQKQDEDLVGLDDSLPIRRSSMVDLVKWL
jgi:hypothetical protein